MYNLNTSKVLAVAIVLLSTIIMYSWKQRSADHAANFLTITISAPHSSALPICEQAGDKKTTNKKMCDDIENIQKQEIEIVKQKIALLGR